MCIEVLRTQQGKNGLRSLPLRSLPDIWGIRRQHPPLLWPLHTSQAMAVFSWIYSQRLAECPIHLLNEHVPSARHDHRRANRR